MGHVHDTLGFFCIGIEPTFDKQYSPFNTKNIFLFDKLFTEHILATSYSIQNLMKRFRVYDNTNVDKYGMSPGLNKLKYTGSIFYHRH